jgi:alkylation response protein AidB-like acyl-CoA dehydrogenase
LIESTNCGYGFVVTLEPDTDLAERVERLLREFPPEATDATKFLLARFDAGLAWFLEPEARALVEDRLSAAGATDPFPTNPIAIGMVGPTILQHGSDEQRERHLRRLWSGQDRWCQLFSEPGSGSDLASLATRADRDGDGWVVDGQKVWTSGADRADFGLLLARTDPDLQKNRGVSAFLIDMRAPGVEVRPLRQMTGDAEFNEVFLDGVRLSADALLGPEGEGWRVAFTTLMNERSSIGSAFASSGGGPVGTAIELLQRRHPADAVFRDRVVRMWIEARLIGLLAERAGEPGPAGSVLKLLGTEHSKRVLELNVDLLGAEGMLDEDSGEGSPWTRGPHVAFLRSRAATIEGGTSEVMRNILGERVLGLPRESDPSRTAPWSDLPRN